MSAKVYALICAWIVVSPAFSAAYAAARVWTWAVYAVCAAAVCTVSLLIRKRGISRVARGIFLWGSAAYILLTSAECVDSYLYHGESAITVLTLLVAAGVIGSLTHAGGSLYGMRTMGMLCCALVALIFALSLGSASRTRRIVAQYASAAAACTKRRKRFAQKHRRLQCRSHALRRRYTVYPAAVFDG